MTRRILGLAGAAALLASCDSTQPPIGCPIQSLEWSAVYTLQGITDCTEVLPGEALGIQKFSTPTGDEQLSITPASLGDIRLNNPSLVSYSLGTLARQADADGFCATTNLAEARINVPPGREPGVDISYRWSNVRTLAIARAPGTQMVAELERRENGCTAKYEVWAMWPGGVSCEGANGEADSSLCAQELTINPDFDVTCHPTMKVCVPAKRPPSLK